ncbi:MAG: exodeoxyribonuclease VII small subunit [Desulfitobacteriaceae bacterium]
MTEKVEEGQKVKSDLSFETGIGKLEQIVKALEQRDVPLEAALSWFKEGISLVQHCARLLDQAEQEMEVLLETDGELRVERAIFPLEG